eukprot:588519-Amphidinium_carterae.1
MPTRAIKDYVNKIFDPFPASHADVSNRESTVRPSFVKRATLSFVHFGGGLFQLLVVVRDEPSFQFLKASPVRLL